MLVLLLGVIGLPVAGAQVSSIPDVTFVPNAQVNAVLPMGDQVYIGGRFTSLARWTGPGLAIPRAAGDSPDGAAAVRGGDVTSVVGDGAGGWYVGGNFTSVGGIPRSGLAHVLADGRVDANFDPVIEHGPISALARSARTLYLGGFFDSVDGRKRSGLAAVDVPTGQVTGWHPSVRGGEINELVVAGSTIYAGGRFDAIGAQKRQNLAALDTKRGRATGWNPNPDNEVTALAVSGRTLYAGGYFGTIGGHKRESIAAVDRATGRATDWNPKATGHDIEDADVEIAVGVTALAVSGHAIYAGGFFNSIGGKPRRNIAALNTRSGRATKWNPHAGGSESTVNALTATKHTVYVGGAFRSIGARPRSNAAALDAATGRATAWRPDPSREVNALAASDSAVYLGGSFDTVGGGQARNHLAALDATTGALTDWNPDADDSVSALAAANGTIYAGGRFTAIGGQPRERLAAFAAATGELTPWNPGVGLVGRSIADVVALAPSGSIVYAGGVFTTIGGQARHNLAALDAATGEATGWSPDPDAGVIALTVSGSTIYVGGYFSSIGGQPRSRLAALDAVTGTAADWNPAPSPATGDGVIEALQMDGSTIYVGGHFTSIGGQPRNNIAALNTSDATATAWNPSAESSSHPEVKALALSGSTVYAGGAFSAIGGQRRFSIAALDTATGTATDWGPTPNQVVYAIATSGPTVYVGGQFTRIGNGPQQGFAQFSPPTNPAATAY
jgi:hypothetical protein